MLTTYVYMLDISLGEYAMLEHENVSGVVESLKIVTEASTERLCRFAFEYAKANGRKKVTLVHKAVSRSFLYHNYRIVQPCFFFRTS